MSNPILVIGRVGSADEGGQRPILEYSIRLQDFVLDSPQRRSSDIFAVKMAHFS